MIFYLHNVGFLKTLSSQINQKKNHIIPIASPAYFTFQFIHLIDLLRG